MQGNLEAEYEILEGLRLIGSAGGSYGTYKREDYATLNLRHASYSNGDMYISRNYDYSYRLLGQIAYDLETGGHVLKATAGFEAMEFGHDRFGQAYQNFNQILGQYGINDVEFTDKSSKPSYSFDKSNLVSFISRVQYNYSDRYLFSVTVRADGSSKFGPENAWGVFPAIGLGWRISEESFMQPIDWISNLKLRGTWGVAGNDNIASYLSLAMYGPNYYYAVFGWDQSQVIVPYHPSQIPNFGIGWETTTEFNIGLDASIFNNRVFATFDLYSRTTEDMLLRVDLPAIVGVDRQTQNKGSLNNRGWEFQVNGVILQQSKWSWDVGMNIYGNLTTVSSLQEEKIRDFQSVNTLIQVGLPLGVKYGYVVEGVNRTQDFKNNAQRIHGGASGSGWGDPVFADITGDGTIDSWDQTTIFNPQALFNGGLNTTIGYGPLELYMFFTASYGSDVYNQNLGELGRTSNLSRAVLVQLGEEMWLPNNQEGTYVGVNGGDFSNDFTSWLIEDGSFLKFATLDLSFKIPKKWISKIKLNGAVLSYSLDNIATLSRYSWFDPDVNSGGDFRYYGTDRSAYPYSRTHVFTLKLTL